MRRVYLDQKDFVRIAHGLAGASEYRTDVEAYRVLESLVDLGKIRVYFSWAHFMEALRYRGERPDLLREYCVAVDRLTQGHCVVFPKEREHRELELALAHRYTFPTTLLAESYAYGKWADAMPGLREDVDMKAEFKRSLRERADKLPPGQGRILLAMLEDDRTLRELLEVIPESTLATLAADLPSGRGFYKRENLVEMVMGSEDRRRARVRELMDGVCTFSNLVGHYGQRSEELKPIGNLFAKDSKRLISIVTQAQVLESMTGERAISSAGIENALSRRLLEGLRPMIVEYAEGHRFSADEAQEWFAATRCAELPGLRVVALLGRAYAAKHQGKLGAARTPHEHDMGDLHHLQNLPYVNYLVTDRFAAEMVKGVAEIFGTVVFRNLDELQTKLRGI
jgi:hypothetical protein